jgi:phenylpropionate dioxygenase-like ring-hydroxylating dioxygenase large terminal subunit
MSRTEDGEGGTVRARDAAASWGDLVHYWYAAARAEDLGKRPLGRVVLGVRVVLWRDADGRARAHRDRCLHRNARLSEGVVVDGCLACPYHGWTYRGDGQVAGVPSLGPAEAAPSLTLPSFPVREEGGLIWVWVGPRAPTEPELAGRRPFPMPHWDEPGWGAYYMVTRFDNGVTHLVENFMDVPHTVFVHRGWFRTRASRATPIVVERTADSVLVTYDRPDDAIGWSDKLMNPRGLPLTHTDKFYAPNHTRVDYLWGAPEAPERAFVITSTCTPISREQTEVFTLISFKLGAWNTLARLWLPPYTRKVIGQDVAIMKNQGDNLRHHGDVDAIAGFHGTSADWLHEDIEALRAHAQWPVGPGPEPRVRRTVIWV